MPLRPRRSVLVLLLTLAAPLGGPALAGHPAPLAAGACVPLEREVCGDAYVAPSPAAAGAELSTHARSLNAASVVAAMATHAGRVWAVEDRGAVWSTDGAGTNGSAWRAEPALPTTLPAGSRAHALAEFRGALHATTSDCGGPRLWRLAGGAWSLVAQFPSQAGCHLYALDVFQGQLFVGTSASRVYRYDGATLQVVLDIGLGFAGAAYSLASDAGRAYAATHRGLWSTANGVAWSQVPGADATSFVDLGAVNGTVYATAGDTLYGLGGLGARPLTHVANATLGGLGDADGLPMVAAYGAGPPRLLRWDGVAATPLLEGWSGLPASARLGEKTYVSRFADGAVEEMDILASVRPVRLGP